MMNTLAVIPARGGSKKLKNKNILPLCGYPLIAHSIFCAHMTEAIDRLVVSTDSKQIAETAEKFGVDIPFMRPEHLARDTSPTWPVEKHALNRIEELDEQKYDVVVLLQPPAPLRKPEDIERGLEVLSDNPDADGIFGVSKPDFDIETCSMEMTENGELCNVFESAKEKKRRQETKELTHINGMLYIHRRDFVLNNSSGKPHDGKILGLEITRRRATDIDTKQDFDEAALKLKSGFVTLPWLEETEPASNVNVQASKEDSVVEIDNQLLGDGLPTFIIAEAGVNHNGEPQKAFELIDVAAEAEADAVKFQAFTPEKLASSQAQLAKYQKDALETSKSQLRMLEKLALPKDTFEELKEYAEKKDLVFLSSVFDTESADLLEKLGMSAFKIGSGELTNLPLLANLASRQLPLLISTGMATLSEVRQAIQTIKDSGHPPFALFHCVSNYPTAPNNCNLKAIKTLQRKFDVPVGWSDHTTGLEASLGAVAIGAKLIEKHFTLDKDLPGPDHTSSLEPSELNRLVDAIRKTEKTLGWEAKYPVKSETETANVARKSLCAATDLKAGHVLKKRDISILRPGTGIKPSRLDELIGKSLKNSVQQGMPFVVENLVDEL